MQNILSSDKTHLLHHTFFQPDPSIRATLLILHGMAEHSERYTNFAQFLSKQGIAVLTYDHLGHGKSVHHNDELGFFAHHHPMQTLLKDTILMSDSLKNKYPNVPHFIMGHSMGSFIVRNVLQHHSNEFTGAILMGTSDKNPITKIALPLTRLLNKTLPKQRNTKLANLTHHILNSKIKKKVNNKHAWVCKNTEALTVYDADPLCGFDFTNNGYKALFELMQQGLNKHWATNIDKDFPMLFVSGKEDPVGDMGKGVKKVVTRLKKQGYVNIESLLYDNMRHEPLHEDRKMDVYNDVLSWLNDTIKVSP